MKIMKYAVVVFLVLLLAAGVIRIIGRENVFVEQTNEIVEETQSQPALSGWQEETVQETLLSEAIVPEMMPSETIPPETIPPETTPPETTAVAKLNQAETEVPETTMPETITQEKSTMEQGAISMENILFIGDSRTVGLADYANLDGADFFATIGMTVYNIWDTTVSVPKVGKVLLEELLNSKRYDIIFVMLGINELGYAFDQTVERYAQIVRYVQTVQPNGLIILMANIHVTASRSEADEYINNPNINRFNEETSKFADNKTVFYLDANSLFDDKDGNLSVEKSSDNAHLKGVYCAEWGEWLKKETANILLRTEGENENDGERIFQ